MLKFKKNHSGAKRITQNVKIGGISVNTAFLGSFTKVRKVTPSFVMSDRMEKLGCHDTACREIWYVELSSKNLWRKFKFHLNMPKITGTLYEDHYTFLIISDWILLRMRNVSDKSCRVNQNTHFVFNIFFRRSRRLWDSVEKIVQQGRPQMTIWRLPTDTHTHTHTHTLRICNTYCFSTATMVARTRLIVRLYVHWLSGLSVGLRRFVWKPKGLLRELIP